MFCSVGYLFLLYFKPYFDVQLTFIEEAGPQQEEMYVGP
jgi:hypothetical protein